MEKYNPFWSNYLNQFNNIPNHFFTNITKDTNKFCVIVEPREHILLEKVIRNFMFLLTKKNWGLIIFHGNKNKGFVNNIIKGWSNVITHNLNVQNLEISSYNKLLKSIEFWTILKNYNCEHSLIFQTDTLLLKDNLDDFLEYDYIGAPWNPSLSLTKRKNVYVGNGGLSLRKVSKMIEYIQSNNSKILSNQNEDIFFSLNYNKILNIAPIVIAKKFSAETLIDKEGMPLGLHKPYLQYFPKGKLEKLLEKRWL
jgi:hypothetical protein